MQSFLSGKREMPFPRKHATRLLDFPLRFLLPEKHYPPKERPSVSKTAYRLKTFPLRFFVWDHLQQVEEQNSTYYDWAQAEERGAHRVRTMYIHTVYHVPDCVLRWVSQVLATEREKNSRTLFPRTTTETRTVLLLAADVVKYAQAAVKQKKTYTPVKLLAKRQNQTRKGAGSGGMGW